ncbi:Bax inhibitor 1 [Branchiostoma belcheri]|nr:Bax inhibitor 1 [Branchiostoma belcheri]
MARKLRHLLIFLLIILKEPNMPEADCECASSLVCSVCGPVTGVALIGAAILTVWYKMKTRHPPLGTSPNVVGGNTNTTASASASGDDHQYEDIDSWQGQSQAITASNTNTTSTVMTSGHDQTGQGQSQANTASNTNTTSTVMTSGHDQAWQFQSQATIPSFNVENFTHEQILAALRPNPRYVAVGTTTTGPRACTELIDSHDQTGQGQSQAITESNRNTTAAVIISDHDQTGQGQSRANAELFDVRNLSYGTIPTASQLNSLYKAETDSQTITNTATVMTSDDDQTGQGQSQANSESLDARNSFYGTKQTSSQLNSLYKRATVMTSGHDQTGQGQSQVKTE